MKCQILFSQKNKKNIINLSSAENAERVVKVNYFWRHDEYVYLFRGKIRTLFRGKMRSTETQENLEKDLLYLQ